MKLHVAGKQRAGATDYSQVIRSRDVKKCRAIAHAGSEVLRRPGWNRVNRAKDPGLRSTSDPAFSHEGAQRFAKKKSRATFALHGHLAHAFCLRTAEIHVTNAVELQQFRHGQDARVT